MTPRRITREQVLDATMRLATEKGLQAVTMRAVAANLDVNPMTLYRHVGDKQGLLDGLVERLMMELDTPRSGQSWQERLHCLAQGMRDTARRHPDLFLLLFQRSAQTEGATGPRRTVYAALRDAGLPEHKIPRAERLLSTFMLGFAASEAGGRFQNTDLDADLAYAERIITRMVVEESSDHAVAGADG